MRFVALKPVGMLSQELFDGARVAQALGIQAFNGLEVLGQRFHVVDALWRDDERLALFLIGFLN